MEFQPGTINGYSVDLGRRDSTAAARSSARAFEATFIAEMLKHAGLNASPHVFGGGAGEDAFASFLNDEYARLLSERGGIGLAERIFQAITQREGTL